MHSLRQAVLAVAVGLFLFTTGVHAQGPAAQSGRGPLIRLKRTRHPLAIPANSVGRVESGLPLKHMLLVLAPSATQEQELKDLLADQSNPNSPNYHHWLTPAEFGARFSAADADVQQTVGWLQAAGFTVERVAGSKRWIQFSGTSAQVESAFDTEMNYYRVRGKTYLANATDLAIPAELGGVTRGPVSLNNFGKRPPIRNAPGSAGRTSSGIRTKLSPNLTASGATTTYYMAPGDFAAIYNTQPLLSSGVDGSGVSIAVTAQSQIELTDVQEFRQIFGLKANDPNMILSGPDPGIADQTDAEEALLDVEWAGAIAPGATINLVVAASTDTTNGVDLAAAYAIDNQVAPILTYTYGSCEQALGSSGNAFYNALWQQAAAEGITVLVASGDNGAAGCDSAVSGNPAANGPAVNGVASTPYNVAVGGTQFNDGAQPSTFWNDTNSPQYSSALGYIPEAAWNESCDPAQTASATNCILADGNATLLASGGGASTVYAKPSWQSGAGVPDDGARDVPDVALAAASGHDEAVYCTSIGGSPCQTDAQQNVVGLTLVGGTSVSTPAMAGVLALIEQKNGGFMGQINPTLYRLAQASGNSCDSSKETNPTAQSSCIFYDVTSGNNQVSCVGGSPDCSSTQSGSNGLLTGETATAGYDLVTGLGSVNAANLAAAWKDTTLTPSQTTLQASSTSFVHGTSATLSGTVSPTSGTGSPTGLISFRTDLYGNSQQTVSVGSKGTFSGSISDLPGGQYNLQAYYAGDSSFAPSESGAVPFNITPEDSTTTLAVNNLQNGAAAYGAPLQLKISAAGLSGQGVATGTVTIQEGGNTIGTSKLDSNGVAYLLTGGGASYAFAPGSHTVTAAYSGDNSFNAGNSAASTFTINKGTPFVVVSVNTLTMPVGQTLGAAAIVSGQGTATATGTVQFTVDGNPFGSPIALQTGGFFGTQPQASTLIPNLPEGTHVIGASYDGSADPNYSSVASGDSVNEFTQTVTVGASPGGKTTTMLVMKTPPVNMGDTGVFTVNVSPTTATGTVTLWDAVGPRTAATPIGGGTATVQFPWTQAGATSVYAVYSGDPANSSSASTPVSFTVQKGVPTVKLVAPANAFANGQVTLNATVTGNPGNPQLPYPIGIVEFWDTPSGGSSQLLIAQALTPGPGGTSVFATRVKLGAGSHMLYAHYRGDTNWQSANSTTVPLDASTFVISVSPATLGLTTGATATSTVTVTAGGGFSGTVALTCPSGGTFVPAGFTCTFASSNLTVNSNAPVTTMLSLTPITKTTKAIKSAAYFHGPGPGSWPVAVGFALLLLSLFVGFSSSAQNGRNFFLSCGLLLCVAGLVFGCGGGGGSGGGGPVSTTTTIISNNAHAAFGMPVTFTVTVTPNGSATPSGAVQLYDNGQAYASPVNVSAGIATFLSTSLPVGVHTFTAQYNGDAGTSPSTSTPLVQVITGTTGLQIQGVGNGITETANITVVVD